MQTLNPRLRIARSSAPIFFIHEESLHLIPVAMLLYAIRECEIWQDMAPLLL